MSELRPQYFQLLKSKFFYLCSFILSQPLYFSYFIFFSPYILKILSFLSPLFVTTTLLLLALFTISPTLILHNNTKGLTRRDNELNDLEEFEAYKIVFGASKIDDQENSIEFLDYASAEESETTLVLDPSCHDKEQSFTNELESTKHVIEEKTLENCFKELDEFENTTLSHDVEVKKVDKIIEKQEEALVRNGLSKNLENVGSMRKEKEWKRTLACKLFEERHNATSHSNSEGMDMLWEKYEMDTTKNKAKRDLKKKKKKGELKGYEYERDEDEQEMDDQQLCCLQALKFSAGKMNLGMGRPNLVKISKAFKGFGWLHHVGKRNKKVHCGELCSADSEKILNGVMRVGSSKK